MTGTVIPVCTSHFVSHCGSVRSLNEDAYLEAPDLGLWAVADGMGGHEAGNLASRLVIDALDAVRPATSPEAMIAQVQEQMAAANRRIRMLSEQRLQGRLTGSTVAVLILSGETAVCLWAGDSRVYRFRSGTLTRLTRDHSRTEEMIALGLLTTDEEADPRYANIITRAVGTEEHLELEQRVEPLAADDVFLLCSDGLTKAVTDAEIAAVIASSWSTAAAGLVDLALKRAATDNVTVGVVAFSGTDDDPPTLVRA